MSTNLPAFINCQETEELVSELRSYLQGKEATFPEESSKDGDIVKDIAEALNATTVMFTADITGDEVEWVFNSFVSLILLIPMDRCEPLVDSFCEKLVEPDSTSTAKLKVLTNLFHGLEETCSYRFTVYSTMVRLAGKSDQINALQPDMDKIHQWVTQWGVSMDKYQSLLRSLHEGLLNSRSDLATKVMIELLGTYTEANASQARDDAQKCIVTCIADPQTFIMDHLLTLKPVKFLEGEPIHDLLTIFVSGRLQQYVQFYESRREFVHSIGLSHEDCMQKMRMLTLMTIAETEKEIPFDRLQHEMHLTENDIESFIIEVVRTKAVQAKIDQVNGQVLLNSTTHRTFGKPQWQHLREGLLAWQQNLGQVIGSLDSLVQHVVAPVAQTAES